MITYIYGLFDPETNELRYVGRTRHLKKRLYLHRTKPSGDLKEWVCELNRRGVRPDMRVLAECEMDGILEEQEWIRKSLREGVRLLNERLLDRPAEMVTVVSVKLPRDVIDDAKVASRASGKTVSQWIEQLIRESTSEVTSD